MAFDERSVFNEKPENRNGRYQCPRCKRTNDYSVRWVRRTKKDQLPGRSDEIDRAKFEKLRSYLLRVDDEVTCKTCGKRFEIPSHHSLVFTDQLEGLPNDEELEKEIAEAEARDKDQ
jgi:DNA-directed RNA polymerase subunit RPC12/RpoP